jgi:hypothetical protein
MKSFIAVCLCLLVTITISYAQYNTGDAQLNISLTQIDANASADQPAFKSQMVAEFNVGEAKISLWSTDLGMKPGDIYMALKMATLLKKPADDVVKTYNANKKKGWGAIAKEMGIKPGSAEFKALKAGAGNSAAKGKGKDKSKEKPAKKK